MTFYPTNATGYPELIDGNLITAVFTLFDTALLGWTITILFIVYQLLLYMKSRNLLLNFIMGIIFVSLYIGKLASSGFPVLQPLATNVMFLILVLELAAIFYYAFWST